MKKSLLIIMTLAMSFIMTSCTKEYITEEYITNEYNGAQLTTIMCTANPKDWNLEDMGNGRSYLYVTFDVPEITKSVMEDGAVLSYAWLVYDLKNGNSSWNQLPYVSPFVYTEDGETKAVGENMRFEYEEGHATFVIEDLDAVSPEEMVDYVDFKLVIISNISKASSDRR